MGLYPPAFVAETPPAGNPLVRERLHGRRGRTAEATGADVIVAQGAEAGGHRGCFDAGLGEGQIVGLFSLLRRWSMPYACRWWPLAVSPTRGASRCSVALKSGSPVLKTGRAYIQPAIDTECRAQRCRSARRTVVSRAKSSAMVVLY